jgi:predicted RNA-binding Zn ribbon-like protein
MNVGQGLVLMIVTALASSLCTLGLGLVVFQRWVRPRLEARLAVFAETLEARVKAGAGAAGQELLEPLRAQVRGGVEEAATELLPRIRAELTAGFQEAAAENLPAFREEVRKGFAEAITSLATTELLGRTAGKVVRTGSSLVESGLSLLRGARPNEREEPPR